MGNRGWKIWSALLFAVLLGPAGSFGQNTPAAAYNPQLLKAGAIASIVQEPDGKLIIGGKFISVNGTPSQNLARLNLDGSVDQTWSASTTGVVNSLVIIGGYVYVGGEFQIVGGATHQNVARISLTGNGSPDPSWSVNTYNSEDGQGRVAVLATDGTNLYVGGDFYDVNGQYQPIAAKITPASSATLDTTWNPNITFLNQYGGVRSILVSGSEVYIGGLFSAPQNAIVKVTASTGALDPNWNAGAFGVPQFGGQFDVSSIALDGTGGLYIAGSFGTVAGFTRLGTAKLSGSTGAVDPVWTPNLSASAPGQQQGVSCVAAANGFIYLYGDFLSAGELSQRYIVRTDTVSGTEDATWTPQIDGPGTAGTFFIQGSNIYIGGNFDTIGGEASLGIAELDPNVGTLVPQFATQAGDTGVVYAMEREPDGKLVIGGDFYYAGGLVRPRLARLNTDGTVDPTWAPVADSVVEALAISGSDIFVGGEFQSLGGLPRSYVGELTTANDAADPNWNPSADGTVDTVVTDGTNVFVGGYFENIGGAAHVGLANLEAGGAGIANPAWSADLGGGSPSYADSLAMGGGELYVGGHFFSIGGVGLTSLARVSIATGTVDTSWTPSSGSYYISAVALSGTNLFFGGSDYGQDTTGVLEDVSTTGNGGTATWTANVAGSANPAYVSAISAGPDALYVGGYFISIDGQAETDLAKLNLATGVPDPTWQKPVSLVTATGDDHALPDVVLAEGDDLLAGGIFTSLSGETRNGFAWLPTVGAPVISQDPVSEIITMEPGPGDAVATEFFSIDAINGGTLALESGTPVNAGSFITVAQGAAGLAFTATTGTASITAQSALDESGNGTGSASTTFLVGKAVPVVQFAATSGSASQGQYVMLTVVESGAGAATVQYATQAGSAAAFNANTGKGDFIPLGGVLNFAPGQTTQTITVPLLEDAAADGNLTFTVALSAANGAQIGSNSVETVTIINTNVFGTPGSNPVITLPDNPTPAATGSLTIDIDPAGVGLWQPEGDFEWHASGATVTGLPAGNYPVQFIPVEGYTTPNTLIEPVASGAVVTDTAQYVQTGLVETGSLTVEIEPGVVATATNSAEQGEWRMPGETAWHNSGDVISGLDAGLYTIEFSPVAGYTTPADAFVNVVAEQTNAVTAIYLIAQPAPGTAVAPVDFATATGTTPYLFVGEIQTNLGYSTGTVVTTHTVLTAAHAIFNDYTLSYVTQINWFFQREHGVYDPPPQIAQGSFVFDSYAAQRATDIGTGAATPDISTPASQNLDVAVLYFLDPPGRGGSGGYLSSDQTPNEWLGSDQLKILAGYPVEDVPLNERGLLFATPALTATFTNLYNEVYATNDVVGFPGVSGGPLFVQDSDGNYYTAGVYLGGTQQTLVRAIDDQVVSLINRAETAGNGGGNNSGGGGIGTGPVDPDAPSLQPPGSIQVTGNPNVGGWRAQNETYYHPITGQPVPGYMPGANMVEFEPVPLFNSPPSKAITVVSGQAVPVAANYVAMAPPSITSTNTAQGVRGQSFTYFITTTIAASSYSVTGTLPPGLTLDPADGIISGVPSSSGSSFLMISATNAAGSGSGPLSILIAPVLDNQTAPTVEQGQPLDYTIMTSDTVTSFTATNPPPGLSFNTGTGELTGTATVPGSYSVPISVTNSGGTANATLSLLVAPEIEGSNTLLGTDSLDFISSQVPAEPGTSYMATGLPPGLSLNSQTALISGTAMQSGTYGVTLSVTNSSGTIPEQITIIIYPLLTVQVAGPGAVEEELAGGGEINALGSTTPPQFAEPVTLEAVASAGSYFAGWTGGLTPSAATFSFNLTNSLLLTAHFASFASAKGYYCGLAQAQAAGSATNALVEVLLDSKGGFSGRVRLGGGAYPIYGAFDANGVFNGTVVRGRPLTNGTAVMYLGVGGITGNLAVSGTEMPLALAQTTADGIKKKSAQAGYYIVALPHPSDATLPQGDGFGSATVDGAGALRFVGTLGDGTPVTEGVSVSDGGGWPFYAAPYSKGGAVTGQLQFDGTGQSMAIGGTAAWLKTAVAGSRTTYPGGFNGSTSVIGAEFNKALPVAYTSGTATIGAGGIVDPAPIALEINGRGRVTGGPAHFVLRLAPATGLFSGTFLATGATKASSFQGVLFQTGGQGYGEFLGGGASTGFFELKAQ